MAMTHHLILNSAHIVAIDDHLFSRDPSLQQGLIDTSYLGWLQHILLIVGRLSHVQIIINEASTTDGRKHLSILVGEAVVSLILAQALDPGKLDLVDAHCVLAAR